MLWAVLVILLLLSAFFSGSETGMMALNRYRLRQQRKKSAGARRAAKLLAKPDRLIGLILIGNNAVNILAAIIANMLAITYVGEAAAPWRPGQDLPGALRRGVPSLRDRRAPLHPEHQALRRRPR